MIKICSKIGKVIFVLNAIVVTLIVGISIATKFGANIKYNVFIVPTSSMADTISTPAFTLVDMKAKEYQRGDIVTFNVPDIYKNMTLCKRIIGLPGETFEIKYDEDDDVYKVYINDIPIDEPYIKEPMDIKVGYNTPKAIEGKITIPDDEYVFLGDNRGNSEDSRYFGTVNKGNIRGKVLFILNAPWKFQKSGDFERPQYPELQ